MEIIKLDVLNDHMVATLEELREDEFLEFKQHLLEPVNLEGLPPIPKSDLEKADRRKTVDLIFQFQCSKAPQIMVNVLNEINREDLLEQYSALPGIYVKGDPKTLQERIIDVLGELKSADLGTFKMHLQQAHRSWGGQEIPRKELDKATWQHTAFLILQYHQDISERVVEHILQTIYTTNRETLLNKLKGVNEKKRNRTQEELSDDPDASTSTIPHDPDASTSTIPRTWHKVSKRWRPQLELLENMDDSKVKKVKSLVFGKGTDRFSLGKDVFLGLRDDGTEVAVKKISQYKKPNTQSSKEKEGYLELNLIRLPELDDPSIVRYVDFVEVGKKGYLALQLCEYTLEEYITKLPEQDRKTDRKQLAKQFLNSLRILHHSNILHRDIKPQNVLIDIQDRARLADFGISRQILIGRSTYNTKAAGTQGWMAKETLVPGFNRYKRSTDIQPAGMLIYYILSGGHHPFGDDDHRQRESNIRVDDHNLDHVVDLVAKDLVEWMILGEPKDRPTVQQCLAHPFFWPNTWREEYLRRIGNEKEVEKHRKAEEDENKTKDEEEKKQQGQFKAPKQKRKVKRSLSKIGNEKEVEMHRKAEEDENKTKDEEEEEEKFIMSLKVLIAALEQYDKKYAEKYAEQGQFNVWKQKFQEAKEETTRQLFEVMDGHNMKKGPDGKPIKKFYSDNSFGLLRFIRNLHAHYAEDAAGINVMEKFPDLFGYVYKFAKEQDWNSRPALKEMFDFCPRCAFTS